MIHEADPAPLLEAAFRRIQAERMAAVPVLNPALSVEALGFARWQEHWLGVLVTPWFMNLVLVPGAEAGWRPVADGQRVFHRFPSGEYAFLGGREPEVGEFQTCALFSPMDRFGDQAMARTVALAAREALLQPPAAQAAAARKEEREAPAAPRPASSRRQFFGRLLGRANQSAVSR
ncbi:MAG: [NiFe]-hydrogenase assembly chaperone HybE [Pseudomonadota bacterium]